MSEEMMIHFLVSWSIKTGPHLTDGINLQRGDTIVITPDLRKWNTTSGWSWLDIAGDPQAQREAFGGNVVMGLGSWPTNIERDGPTAPRPYWFDPEPDGSEGKYLIKNATHRHVLRGDIR